MCLAYIAQLDAKCPVPEIINHTDTWTERDLKTLVYAKKRCKTMYDANHCLKTFYKTEELTYRAICFEPEEE